MNCLLRGRAGEVTVFASPGSLLAGNLPAALCRRSNRISAVGSYITSEEDHVAR